MMVGTNAAAHTQLRRLLRVLGELLHDVAPDTLKVPAGHRAAAGDDDAEPAGHA